jgi:serine/threonine protein kinase
MPGAIRRIRPSELQLQKVVRTLGGAHVHLRLGEWKDERTQIRWPCCVKEASLTRSKREKRSEEAAARLKHEAQVLSLASAHKSVIDLYGVCPVGTRIPSQSDEIFFQTVLEQCAGGTLFDLFPHSSIRQGLWWLYEIADAMSYVHSCNIVHRDLKPSNILFADRNSGLRVADFDSSVIVDNALDQRLSGSVGTLKYMSPELLLGVDYGKPTDVYSFGILAFEVLTKSHAHEGLVSALPGNSSRRAFEEAVVQDQLRPSFPSHLENLYVSHQIDSLGELKNLVSRCWSADETRRPTFLEISTSIAEIIQAIDHRVSKTSPNLERTFVLSGFGVCGKRSSMEDEFLSVVLENHSRAMAGVFDGHCGDEVAGFAKERAKTRFESNNNAKADTDFPDSSPLRLVAPCSAFDLLQGVEIDVQTYIAAKAQSMGSTASIALVDHEFIDVAWLGDSNVVLCERAVAGSSIVNTTDLTLSHVPASKNERQLVESFGGIVSRLKSVQDDGNEYPYGPFRVFDDQGCGGLAVSRVLGDLDLRPYVSGIPSSIKLARDPKHLFLILATDGLWDVFSPNEACRLVMEMLGAEPNKALTRTRSRTGEIDVIAELLQRNKVFHAAKKLSSLAVERGSQDNVSCVVVLL